MSGAHEGTRNERRSLRWIAFLSLWGGWSTSVFLFAGLWLHDEWSPSLAWFVVVPLTFGILVLIYAPKAHPYLPGSYKNNSEFVYASSSLDSARPRIVLAMPSTKANWGRPQRRVRFGKSFVFLRWTNGVDQESRWKINRAGKEATRRGSPATTVDPNEEGLKIILHDLASEHYSAGQREAVARSMYDYLVNRGPRPPMLRVYPWLRTSGVLHWQGGDAGRVSWPWRWIAASVFSALLLPLTWATVRYTTLPSLLPIRGSA